MRNFIKKLSEKLLSRKLWLYVAGVVSGIAVAIGVEGDAISTVAGSVTAAISVLSYIIVEGKIDTQRAAAAAEKLIDGAETIRDAEKQSGDDSHK